ncbi:MAG: hypothetical protein IKN49_05880 [Elusimicrobiaceae bacterium]|nr:hypothetical protein [Elusimicrobiaceae bacterium]
MKQEKTSSSSVVPSLNPAQGQHRPAAMNPYKKWGIIGGLVFFLFLIIFVIPAGSWPGLRKVVSTLEEAPQAQSWSVGRILWTWARAGFPFQSQEAQQLSLFDRKQSVAQTTGTKSGLIDLAAVNVSRRARGLRADGIAGAYEAEEGDDRAALSRPVGDWSDEAKASAEKSAKAVDVYLGTDADLLARADSSAGQGSADTAQMRARSVVAGTVSSDMLASVADSMSASTDAALRRALAAAATASANTSIRSGTDLSQKAQQDLAQVFVLTNIAEKAPEGFKNQLVTAGYMAGTVSAEAYEAVSAPSVSLRGAEKVAPSAQTGKTEEQCQQQAKQTNEQLAPVLERSRELIRHIRQGVPQGCGAELSNWKSSLIQVREQCQTVKKLFLSMRDACGMNVPKEGSCETVYLDAYAGELSEKCEALSTAKAQVPVDKSQVSELTAQINTLAQTFDQMQLDNSFNLRVDGVLGTNDFFPQTDNTQWLTQEKAQ